MTLRLLSYNIRYGGTGREDRIAAVVRECSPDVVVFQEATDPRVVARVAELAGLGTWAARPSHSMGFASRVEIAHHEWHRPTGARHPFLEIIPAGTEFRIFGLHLSAVHSTWTEHRRVRELRALMRGIAHHQEGFHVLVGDFNALSPGELLDARRLPPRLRVLVWLSGGATRLKQAAIQTVLDGGYVDGYRTLHPNDPGYTFPTWDPHVRLDYAFVPARYADRMTDCQVFTDHDTAKEASDHFPLLSQIEVG